MTMYSVLVNKISVSVSILRPRLFLLCAETISDHNTTYIPCAILELSGTIPESADRVGIPTLRRTIPELSRFLHCAEYIYGSNYLIR